jgi:hypothetical protein
MTSVPDKPLPDEHVKLLEEAEQLGVDTLGYTVHGAKLDKLRGHMETAQKRLQVELDKAIVEADELEIPHTNAFKPTVAGVTRLRELIGREVTRRATIAASKASRDEELLSDEAPEPERGAFDELMGDTRGVLVRVTQWTEWLPTNRSEHEHRVPIANGVTGLEAGEEEKLMSIVVTSTQQVKMVTEDDEKETAYTLYMFQATLAMNVKTSTVADQIRIQGGDRDGSTTNKALTPKIHVPSPQPNRATRRAKK